MKLDRTALLACVAALLAGPAAHAHESAGAPAAAAKAPYDASTVEEKPFGREGDPRRVTRTIRVDMRDSMRFMPDEITVRRGETVRFVVTNSGRTLHEFVLGTTEDLQEHARMMQKFPNMQHEEPHIAHVKPGSRGEVVWQFTKAGHYEFACLVPGHFEAGMAGKVIVR